MLASNPNTDFWTEIDNEESYTDLVMAIEFSDRDRVSLFIAVCDVDLIQAQIISRYTEQLAEFRAYQIAVNSHHLSVNRSIAELVESEPYFQTGERVVVSVVGATALASVKLDPEATKSDRDTFFGYLQWTRESFRDFHFSIVLWVSKNIYDLMLSETPDFWSWRTGVFFFKADLETFNEGTIDEIAFDFGSSNLHDQDLNLSVSDSISLADLEKLTERIIQRNPEDPLLISLYNSLANLYQLQGQWLEAENLALQALNIYRQLFGNHPHKDLATSLNNVAELYRLQGRWTEAELLLLEALSIYHQLFGDKVNKDLAISLSNLAILYQAQGRWTEAEPLLLKVLNIYRHSFGNDVNEDLDLARSLNNLATLYQAQGRWAEAEPLLLEALSICRHLFRDNVNNYLAISLNNVAELYRLQGRWAEAEPLHLESLTIRRQLFGANINNDVASSLNNLALLYQAQRRWGETEPLFLEALSIRRQLFGNRPHHDLATSLNNLAGLYRLSGRYAEAESLLAEVPAISEEQLVTNDPDTYSDSGANTIPR